MSKKIEKKIYTDELPKKKDGIHTDWNKTIGMNVKALYKGKEYIVKILDYKLKDRFIVVQWEDKIMDIYTSSFLKGCIGKLIGEVTDEFKIEIGTIINGVEIIDIKKEGACKYYKIKCPKCGFDGNKKYYNVVKKIWYDEHWILESNLLVLGNSCPCCCLANKNIVEGINDILTTDAWMIKLGISEIDAKTHSSRSGDRIKVKCPDCGKEKYVAVSHVFRTHSIGCTCGDGTSYPEKFIMSVLDQLNIKYKKEYSPNWAKPKRYDFYIDTIDTIIEAHGVQHYKETNRGGRTLEEEQENDKLKERMALNNGIKNYITIDCRESNVEFLKSNIVNSELSYIFDLNKVNFTKCEEFAMTNLKKEVCEYWRDKDEWETTADLIKRFNLDNHTIINYLTQGSKIWDWCNYGGKEEQRKSGSKNGKASGKPIIVFKDDVALGIFENAHDLDRKSEELFGIKLLCSGISYVCTGKHPSYKSYTFKYLSDLTPEEKQKYGIN